MTQPFLSIMTRCYARPTMLEKNKRSVDEQTCKDWNQLLIVDIVGRGLHWANQQFHEFRHHAVGQYVLMLDDDDRLTRPDAIDLMREAVLAEEPDILFFRGNHGDWGVLPTNEVWGDWPKVNHVSGQDFIVRADLWKKHIAAFGAPIEGDARFLESLRTDKPKVAWLDEVLVEQQWIGKGRPESDAVAMVA